MAGMRGVVILVIILTLAGIRILGTKPVVRKSNPIPSLIPTATLTPEPGLVVPPIAEFKTRITKKFFGTYITPANSPVMPERFTGFHTGVDAEYEDVNTDVPVYAIADGIVVLSKYASGYGGVMVIKVEIDSQILYAIYGHLNPGTLLTVNTRVVKGEKIALLGTGYTRETDGERRHLHFGIAKTDTIAGYVSDQTQLNATWADPLTIKGIFE